MNQCSVCGIAHLNTVSCGGTSTLPTCLPVDSITEPTIAEDAAWDAHCKRHLKKERELLLQNQELQKKLAGFRPCGHQQAPEECQSCRHDSAVEEICKLKGEIEILKRDPCTERAIVMERLNEAMQKVVDAARAYSEVFNMRACNAMETSDTMHGLSIKVQMTAALETLDSVLSKYQKRNHETKEETNG